MQMTSAGSIATRRTIEKYQPMLGLHGHIHESKGQTNIRKTPCFNPGSEYTDGTLRGILLNLEGNKIKNYTFTSG